MPCPSIFAKPYWTGSNWLDQSKIVLDWTKNAVWLNFFEQKNQFLKQIS